ncbi:ribonucleoside-triphosphate reductase [Desulfitispora alkaliphila]|uniref:anaerobic ribonucleoside triphosphate reductase n=1 Tax=Desulfitispora alkaliphila TaxID=622674 RepID=UPI003D22497B
MIERIQKRDGRYKVFRQEKIADAIYKALVSLPFKARQEATNGVDERDIVAKWAEEVTSELKANTTATTVGIEKVQDTVEKVLMRHSYELAKAYMLYRDTRNKVREKSTRLMKAYYGITFSEAEDSNDKRENANVNGNTAMGTMLQYGSTGAKEFNMIHVLNPEHAKLHNEGDLHIHDMDFLTLTLTCCQIDPLKLFPNGFGTGHGFLREPQDIMSYTALAAIAIQANQNDQHGGQSIPNFDHGMAPGVRKTYVRTYKSNLAKSIELLLEVEPVISQAIVEIAVAEAITDQMQPKLDTVPEYLAKEKEAFLKIIADWEQYSADILAGSKKILDKLPSRLDVVEGALEEALEKTKANVTSISEEECRKLFDRAQQSAGRNATRETERSTFQAMEAFIHNLNTMHSRAGAQVPFSSVNFGTDTTPEGRLVTKSLLLAQEQGLGNGENPIFPILIFKVKTGVNYNQEDPNYDLFKLAIHVSSKRLFPNFSFQDASFNKPYSSKGMESEVAYMGCRTRVIGNAYDPEQEVTAGRGNLSFTSLNLPRIALESKGDVDKFFLGLDEKIDAIIEQLLERFEIQARRKVKNMPFLMGQGIWLDSDKLQWNDEVREVIKHGTLSMGFIGLAESLIALIGKHHGEAEEAQKLGIKIVSHMRERLDQESQKRKLNFTLIASPAEGLAGRFTKMDKERFGVIPGVTDKDYYTNSFHVPVWYGITAFDKIKVEAPYHKYTNAGHITYIELDGQASKNVEAFEAVIKAMYESDIGYGSINHPVDRDPVCGYTGIIKDECPNHNCRRKEGEASPITGKGEGINFERIRRITGYLVGDLKTRWNDAKLAEEKDRIKHSC